MIKKMKKLLFGCKDKIEYEEYIKIRNCELNKENLWIKYHGDNYEANNKYYENGYWFYFKIEENPNGEIELKTYLSGEKEEEFLSIIYRLNDVKIGFVSEEPYKDENGEYPIFLEYFKDDKKTLLGTISGLNYGDYSTSKHLYGLLFFSKKFSIKEIILKKYKNEKGEEIITPEYIDEYNLDELLVELRKEKVPKTEPIVIEYLQKLKEYRDKENENHEKRKNVD
ncbi:hypothetical protein [Fusobacterium animalis]|jgi:recombinase|uniref:hypothetical protein n=1 Tax=Fusobacterium animalis TaxID=76859 RepID=UPI0032488523